MPIMPSVPSMPSVPCARPPQYVNGLVGKYEANWTKEGIDIVKGLASFDDAQTVRVQLCAGGEQVIKAAKVLVAVGGRPALPEDVPGIELAISSDGFFELEQQPKKVAVLGAGCATPAIPCTHSRSMHMCMCMCMGMGMGMGMGMQRTVHRAPRVPPQVHRRRDGRNLPRPRLRDAPLLPRRHGAAVSRA